jgi:hypothetical protein
MVGAELFADVLELNDKIHVQYLPSIPKFLTRGGKALFLILGPLKVLFQIFSLFRLLFAIRRPSYILVQVDYFEVSRLIVESPLNSYNCSS